VFKTFGIFCKSRTSCMSLKLAKCHTYITLTYLTDLGRAKHLLPLFFKIVGALLRWGSGALREISLLKGGALVPHAEAVGALVVLHGHAQPLPVGQFSRQQKQTINTFGTCNLLHVLINCYKSQWPNHVKNSTQVQRC
jgi:hypothetical protein